MEKNKSIEAGSPIALRCEISDPTTEVCWYKDGVRLHPQSGNAILSEGTLRTLVVQAAGPSHSGVYSCQTKDTALHFAVDIKGDSKQIHGMVVNSLLINTNHLRTVARTNHYGAFPTP